MSATAQTHTPKAACHRECPDLACYSLNAEQKAQGLINLQKVRSSLKEKQLQPLRVQRKELVAQATHQDTSAVEQARISKEIRRIDSQAQRISERWS